MSKDIRDRLRKSKQDGCPLQLVDSSGIQGRILFRDKDHIYIMRVNKWEGHLDCGEGPRDLTLSAKVEGILEIREDFTICPKIPTLAVSELIPYLDRVIESWVLSVGDKVMTTVYEVPQDTNPNERSVADMDTDDRYEVEREQQEAEASASRAWAALEEVQSLRDRIAELEGQLEDANAEIANKSERVSELEGTAEDTLVGAIEVADTISNMMYKLRRVV